jgi:toxin CcdB
MARFDVHRLRDGSGLVMNCQADLLWFLDTCFVVPLFADETAPKPSVERLNPSFLVAEKTMVMMTQFAGTIPRTALGPVVVSLADHQFEIGSAIELLIGGV